MDIILARHAETVFIAAARMQGHMAHTPLTRSGIAQAEARGTLVPWTVETRGGGRLDRLRAGAVPVGDVPFQWATERGVVVISVAEASVFGGRLSADGVVIQEDGRFLL